jgi:Zn-dependent protease/CBS domain-containing protein
MPAGSGLTLFRVGGIRIAVDFSWFFVLFLVILWLSDFYRDVLDVSTTAMAPYALAVISALLFFASILLHELGHAFVAVRKGIGIADITLWMFGGVARMQRDSDTPGTEFKIAIAGPIVTLALVLVSGAIGLALAGQGDFWEAMRVEEGTTIPAALAVVAWLTSINLLVLLFNLIPAYPLDGGRVARSIAWRITGDRSGATRFAATLGQGFAWLLIAVGLFLLIDGDTLGGIWLGVLGFVLYQSARAAQVQSEVASKISGVTVGDVMDREPVAIPEALSVSEALDDYFLRYRWPWFPVVDAAQRFRGLLKRGAADAVPEPRREFATVREVAEADAGGDFRVREDEPLESLLGNENLRRLGALMAVDAEGRLRGVITLDQVGRALRTALSGSEGRSA